MDRPTFLMVRFVSSLLKTSRLWDSAKASEKSIKALTDTKLTKLQMYNVGLN
jgi:hypothetical protein